MANYRIDCSIQTNCTAGGHITGVKIGNTQYTVREIYEFIDGGHQFYTVGPQTRKIAWVRKFDCGCRQGTLKSNADATTDNNLDSLVC